MLSLLLVLQGMMFTPLQDSVALKATADSFNVPVEVVYAVAWMETRDGKRWNALGPGVIDSSWLADGTLRVHRTCRELGRFQLRGCVNWKSLLVDPVCSYEKLRTVYGIGVHCGVRNLRRLFERYGSWLETIRRQNGNGSKAEAYLRDALMYLGWRKLSETTIGRK